MGILINEQKMIDENTFRYEEKIKSPTSRFLDTAPTFVTYYHINADESTTDEGFSDVKMYIGDKSPIRFNKTENFPIYGLDQIVLQLQDDDAGLDSTYESEAIILPQTIKPVQNDYFVIPVVRGDFVFRVTDIDYDTLMPNNFYRISFKLEYNDYEMLNKLNNQVLDNYVCILENIGTESNCIIEKQEFADLEKVHHMYREMCTFYKAMFYNERYNDFLCPLDNYRYLYDPLQTYFINVNGLFNEKRELTTIVLTDQFEDPLRKYKYSKSIYKFVESRDKRILSNFKYNLRAGVTFQDSAFHHWHDKTVDVLDITDVLTIEAFDILSDDFVNKIRTGELTNSNYCNLIINYLNGNDLAIKDIPLDLDEELVHLNNCMEVFFFTPIILYIIKNIINKNLKIVW